MPNIVTRNTCERCGLEFPTKFPEQKVCSKCQK